MSFDLSIWRRSPTTKTAMIVEVYEVLGVDDQDHPAAGMFDTREFVSAVASVYRGTPQSDGGWYVDIPDEAGQLTSISLFPWTGAISASIHVSGPFDMLKAASDALVPFVLARDLMLYDPQSQSVFNNRRSYT